MSKKAFFGYIFFIYGDYWEFLLQSINQAQLIIK